MCFLLILCCFLDTFTYCSMLTLLVMVYESFLDANALYGCADFVIADSEHWLIIGLLPNLQTAISSRDGRRVYGSAFGIIMGM
ncbi:hypothetical protein OSB04_008306 [Centaurea solstitialis]|uniref:Uncharacterized protein n=1 Tax=Centaurea solstitialis TaxID=347529 RepID=A0AA38TZA0_9ASTR|nr:hypothetical protein OSB04_008306 [Centaurea solstitialis]